MSSGLLGAVLGLLSAAGLLLVTTRLPAFRRPRLEDRLSPYLRDTPRASRLLDATGTLTPFPTLERILGPVLGDGVRILERVLGGSSSVRRKLEQEGGGMTLEEFRAEQLLWGAAALLGSLAISVLALTRGAARQPLVLLAMSLLAGVGGILLRDRWLSRSFSVREERMMLEFPTIAELLALAVAAGEGPSGALERVTRISKGELSRELSRALADVRAGASLVQALQGMAERTSLPALSRFVDGVAIAVERGTPLAEVLRAQAVDVREAGRRALLESGGRKEIGMMIPVVFMVLPVTVVFALFPGFANFSIST